MLKTFPKLALIACLLLPFAPQNLWSQFKKVYSVDTTILNEPNLFTATKVLQTNMPGNPISISGTLNVSDSTNFTHQSIYNLMTDLHGNPKSIHMFEDSSSFLFQGPRGYAACYDGNGSFYYAVGSNNRQLVIKADTSGAMDWSRSANHHEFYSIVCESNGVAFLGQDESLQGAHDFSLGRMDANGVSPQGNMFGTMDFEQPYALIRSGNDYVMAGSSFKISSNLLMIVKADDNFQKIWGKVMEVPGKNMYCETVQEAHDGSGYIFSGRARGGSDSVFVLKTDTAGNNLWLKLYSIGAATEVYNSGITVVPSNGDILLCGAYRGPQYLRPFILSIDKDGAVNWVRDYGDQGNNTDETLNDIIYNTVDDYFYAVGDFVGIYGSRITYRVITVKGLPIDGAVTCDSALTSGSKNQTLSAPQSVFTEPFFANNHHPMGSTLSSNGFVQTRCSVIVAVSQPNIEPQIFDFVNPSDGKLQIRAQVPENGGKLQVFDLSGVLVFSKEYEEGLQKETIALDHLSAGMYIVRLSGVDWSLPAKRWAIQK